MTASRSLTAGLVLVLGVLMTANPLAASLFLPGLGVIVDELGTTVAGGQMVYTGFLLGVAGGQLLIGPLSDATGRRPALLCGLGLLAASAAASAAVGSIELLVATRVAQGLGAAAVVVVARAVVADLATGVAAARAYSILMSVIAAGPFAAPILGAAALQLGGWRAGFLVLAVFAALALAAAAVLVPESLERERRQILRFGAMAANYGRLLRDGGYVLPALSMAFAFAALAVHSAASSFVTQEILHTGPWGFALVYALYAGSVLAGSTINAVLVGRFGIRRMMAAAQGAALVATAALLVFALWGPFTLVTFLVPVLVSGAAASAVLAGASALALSRARFAAGAGAALMGSAQYAVAAAAAPVGGVLGSHTAGPMAAGMLVCLVISAVCAARTRP
ncbi:DHA1 family bicyclomycin/chloramphenicol resistance-like MFS transporter [Microbacterium sp. SORGH_AS428]|uniref:Bcr/CflA family efflux MFS transporter n=1 Tax=Microbacterium sp. SORGH_AS_0428 TaxID=3041788 RepID=UPI00285D17B8|nr:Bcr/CflA family efflux MFS transporter [Microbacterium sp. SORGH_AS_0428]MDR6199471.1 DHA1 family bicyclomycin/chloramphenicol resistance-like MFS transporter [Microbacterium sp. SORGH_AS_0428]